MTQAYAPGSPYPATPIGFLQLPTNGTDVKLNGSVALVATGKDVLLVNLANPFQPVVAGYITGTFGNWLTLTSDGFLVSANNTGAPSSIQTATFRAVVKTSCPSPLSAALISR